MEVKKITLMATSTFGLEAIVKREVQALGFKVTKVVDGRVEFEAMIEDIPRANLWLRAADRVLLKLAEFEAKDFDELFDQAKILDWSSWISKDARIDLVAKCVRSKIDSVRSTQSIAKKAIIEQLRSVYKLKDFPETGAEFAVHVSVIKNQVVLSLDTTGTGQGLHKRSYRLERGEVPLRENLASALVQLSFWKADRILVDPMCGSGTILIEAAMIAKNIAPGLNRSFASEQWSWINTQAWSKARTEAQQAIRTDGPLKIFGYDISPERIKNARNNAKQAGVGQDIVFQEKDIRELKLDQNYGVMISNPPYGEKLGELSDLPDLYKGLNQALKSTIGWSLYIITSDSQFEHILAKESEFLNRKPDRVRKLFNGTIEVHYYQYYGAKPPRN